MNESSTHFALRALCLFLVLVTIEGCHTGADCQAVAESMARGQVAGIRSTLEDAATLGGPEGAAKCLQAVVEEHPSASTDSVLEALQPMCDRAIVNALAAQALEDSDRRLGRLVVLGAIYLQGRASGCEGGPDEPIDKRLIDVVVFELSDTALVQSTRWRGHAGSDQSLSRYCGLARMALYGLLPMTAASAADSMQLDLTPRGDPLVAARAFQAWWVTTRDDVTWVEQIRAFMPARVFE